MSFFCFLASTGRFASILKELAQSFRNFSASDEYLVSWRETNETIMPILDTVDVLLQQSASVEDFSTSIRTSILEDANTPIAKYLLVGEEEQTFSFPTFSTKVSLFGDSTDGIQGGSNDTFRISGGERRLFGSSDSLSGNSEENRIFLSEEGLEALGISKHENFMASLSTFRSMEQYSNSSGMSDMNLKRLSNAQSNESVLETRLVEADTSQSLTLSFRRSPNEANSAQVESNISFSQGKRTEIMPFPSKDKKRACFY